MNLEKINDFIEAYSKALQIDNEYTAILKELIPKLVEKYSKIFTNIPVEQDNENKYIIKPVDGKYSIEDFFLNRLMRNVLSLNIGNIGNREKGGFIDSKQTIDLDIELIDKQLQGVISEKNPQYQQSETWHWKGGFGAWSLQIDEGKKGTTARCWGEFFTSIHVAQVAVAQAFE